MPDPWHCTLHTDRKGCRGEWQAKGPWSPEDDACPIRSLKKRIVTLRRTRRRAVGREVFAGFRAIVEADPGQLVKTANTRWLVSVLDTYADWAPPAMAATAMLGVVVANWEKLAWCSRGDGEPVPLGGRRQLWDGMRSLTAAKTADMPRNLAGRLRKVSRRHPELHVLLAVILKRIARHPRSTIGLLNAHHARDLAADFKL